MPSNLHGGGIPFIADLTIDQISDLGENLDVLEFSAPRSVGDGTAKLSLRKYEDPGDVGGTKIRMQFTGAARELLKMPDLETRKAERVAMPHEMMPSEALAAASPNLYYRLVDTTGSFHPLDDSLLRKVAKNLREPSGTTNNSTIPAIYTYFGQFIAHELTRMDFSGTSSSELGHRSHAFDLDSVFGALSAGLTPHGDLECLAHPQPNHLCIGLTSKQRFEDIPRTSTGMPSITDARNENNLVIAQLYVAITKFIFRLQEINGFTDIEKLQIEASRYLQSIVINDYLPTICDAAVLTDIVKNGRKVVFPGAVPPVFHLPTEFAAACFRFGHSMVNSAYPWNSTNRTATLFDTLNFTHLGLGLNPNPNGRLIDDWVVDWSIFHGPGSVSKPIDTNISSRLGQLPANWIDEDSGLPASFDYDLSYITLFRAIQFRLANAQQIISHLNSHGIVIPPSGLTPEIFDGLHKVCADLSDAERAEINNNTPLWLYVLREAEVRSDGRLGPVGSRIVAESIHASIEAAENNILTGNEFIVASELSEKETSLFTLDMMIEAVTSGSM